MISFCLIGLEGQERYTCTIIHAACMLIVIIEENRATINVRNDLHYYLRMICFSIKITYFSFRMTREDLKSFLFLGYWIRREVFVIS